MRRHHYEILGRVTALSCLNFPFPPLISAYDFMQFMHSPFGRNTHIIVLMNFNQQGPRTTFQLVQWCGAALHLSAAWCQNIDESVESVKKTRIRASAKTPFAKEITFHATKF